MRLRRLDLSLYGMFTGRSIDFGEKRPGHCDLHVIYGPNETGKTTTVAAYLDLLYGIKTGKYAFLHSETTMRIGGALEIGGQVHEFIRIKAASNSLLDAHGQPIAESAIRAELGAIERDGYCSMFSLDDDTLEKGGDDILKSRGDLGQLLFSASAGLSELSQQLVQVREEADAFYKLRGRQLKLTQLKEKLATLKAERDTIDTQASKYAELVQTRDRLAEQYKAALTARGATQARKEEVQRHLLALPGLARLRSIRHELPPFENLPEAPQAWSDELQELIRQELTLGGRMDTVVNRIEEIENDLVGMVLDQAGLGLAERMEGLGELRSRHVTAVKDIPKLQGEVDEAELTIRSLLAQIGRPGEADPQRLVLEAAVVGSLRDLMETRSGIEAARRQAAEELAQAEQDLEDAREELREAGGSSGDEAKMAALSSAVAAARAVDHLGRCRTAKHISETAAAVLAERLAELKPWQEDGAALAAMMVPGADDLARWKLALGDVQRRIDQRAGEVERLTSDVERLTAELAAIGGTTGVVTDEEAGRIRTAREQAWAEHRRAMDAITADAFESVLRHEDLAVNGRLMHATELANLHRIGQDLAVRKGECERAAELLKKATTEKETLLGELESALLGMGSGLSPDTTLAQLEAWLARRDHALEARRQAQDAAAELGAAEDDAKAATERLRAALAAAGVAVGGEVDLDELLAAADGAVNAETTLKHLRSEVRSCEREAKRRERAHVQAKADEEQWLAAWSQACASCWLGEKGAVPPPGAVRATLEALGKLDSALASKANLTRRITSMRRDQKSFADEVATVAAELGLPAGEPLATAKAVADRVKEAEAAQTRRIEAEGFLETERRQHKELKDAHTILEDAKTKMTVFFGVATLEEVNTRLSSLAKRAELTGQLAQAEKEMLEAMRLPTIAEAEATLASMDRAALEREQIDLDGRFDDEDERCREFFSQSNAAAAAVDAVGGDARVAEIEERRHTVLLEIEDGARRYLRLRIGTAATEQALRIYRDRHRSSMMNQASKAFSLISRGAYSRLQPQRRKDSEVLVAITSAGGSKDSDQLSKGTRFQLYLALRVAGYHEFVTTRTPVPFVSDDIMETFDDFRAEEAFRLFANMAELGQVIYLTHHPHLCAIARQVCPDVQIHELGPIPQAVA